MTTKELLRLMVDAMTDQQADRALRALESIGIRVHEVSAQQRLPSFVGLFASGDGALSQHTDDLLADGFGR